MRLILLLIILITFPAFSAWHLDNDKSSVSFISIKKSDVAEAHHFNQLNGNVDNSGKVSFDIDLLSVDTNIAIRNERMKEFLFNTEIFPKATFTAQLDMNKFNAIAKNSSGVMKLIGEINLHGHFQKVMVDVLIAKLSDKEFIVSSMKPVLLNADKFALGAGVRKLKELAKLPSISHAVPVSFVLSFNES
jgi:polyisoprenoid-binding protein YceI